MNSPEEAPKLSKLPFLAGDLLLLATAALIATRSAYPITPSEILAITICVVLGAALLVIPFLVNYARRQDAVLSDRQNQIAALARTTSESAEQISIAVAGIHRLVSSLPKPAAPGDDPLIRRLAQLDTAAKTQSDALGTREKALAAALSHATRQIEILVTATAQATAAARPLALPATPLTVLPAAAQVSPQAPGTAIAPAAETAAQPPAAAQRPAPPAASQPKIEPVPTEPAATAEARPLVTPAEAPSPTAIPTPETPAPLLTPAAFTAAEPLPDEVPVDAAPQPPKAPRPRKPKSVDAVLELGLTSDLTEPMPCAPTADGVTRLLATAYIGIGQKLHLRGDGPGLSWEKGVPLQFVSIGKWLWQTADATAPFAAKLYKNDLVECTGLGSITLEPGCLNEVNAGF